ncbi:MAG: PDZ domain-containing protein [Planctomycetes bacterium]|nr:PDZ domain-containing protein [Planctomycetota bacterium]
MSQTLYAVSNDVYPEDTFYEKAPVEDPVPDEKNKTAFLGVYPSRISDAMIAETGIDAGVYIMKTVPGTAADSMGIQSGDIVTSINGQEILGFKDIYSIIRNHKPDDDVKIIGHRDGEEIEFNGNLGSYPRKQPSVRNKNRSRNRKQDIKNNSQQAAVANNEKAESPLQRLYQQLLKHNPDLEQISQGVFQFHWSCVIESNDIPEVEDLRAYEFIALEEQAPDFYMYMNNSELSL